MHFLQIRWLVARYCLLQYGPVSDLCLSVSQVGNPCILMIHTLLLKGLPLVFLKQLHLVPLHMMVIEWIS